MGSYTVLQDFAEKIFDLRDGSLGIEIGISIQIGDILFMLDTVWNLYDQFYPHFAQARKLGGKVITMVHDLIPIRFPETCVENLHDVFEDWLQKALQESDEIVCVSRSTADDLIRYIYEDVGYISHPLDIAVNHNGADIQIASVEGDIHTEVQNLVNDLESPLFLMVGTLEPRKGHAFVLDAFEYLWRQDFDYKLCIIGRIGWNIEKTEKRIRNHPELWKRIFFFENASDAELNLCYSKATALITASIAEGFGLPIVEAALHGVPAIANDIPVFREIGGEGALYFSLESPNNLCRVIQEISKLDNSDRTSMAQKVKVTTWEKSATLMMDVIKGRRVYLHLDGNSTKHEKLKNWPKNLEKEPTSIIDSITNSNENNIDVRNDDDIQANIHEELIETNQDQISSVKCRIADRNSKDFQIVVQKDAKDAITNAIISGTFGIPYHYQMLFDIASAKGKVIDLGAHIGTFSLFAAVNEYDVISIEASPINVAFLKESVRINKFNNLKIISAAVSDHAGTLQFMQSGPYGAIANPLVNNRETISIPAVTVDMILDKEGWDRVDFIKMDIEGSEVAAIQGMPQLLSNLDSPAILYESNGFTLSFFDMTPQILTSILESFGYNCYLILPGELISMTSHDLQLECVSDCLAIKNIPLQLREHWSIRSSMPLETKISVALDTCNKINPIERAYIGRTLEGAEESLLEDLRIITSLDTLSKDSFEEVRNSVDWWVRRRSRSAL